jgi:hypothetical protein
MRTALASLLASAIALTAGSALAQPKEPAKAAGKEAAKPTDNVRRDPEGKTGISPYMELIAKGEAAFVARDFAGAIASFQEAIKLDGTKMLGFYRMGEAQLASAKLEEVLATWQSGLGKKGTEDLNAKLLFVIADLYERQGNLQAAKDAWAAYAAFLQNNAKASGYAGTPVERQKQADRRMKDEKDYAVVKERIAKREAEKLKEAEENAKKDKLNR